MSQKSNYLCKEMLQVYDNPPIQYVVDGCKMILSSPAKTKNQLKTII